MSSSALLRLGHGLMQQLAAHLGLAPHDLDQQTFLGLEVVMQQTARDTGLAGHVIEGGAGNAALGHAGAHGLDDPGRLVSRQVARRGSPR